MFIKKDIKNKKSFSSKFFRNFLYATCFGALVLVSVLFLFSFFFSKVSLPLFAIKPCSTIAAVISVGAASVMFSFLQQEKGVLCGCVEAFFSYTLLCILSLSLNTDHFTELSLIKLICFLSSGVIGGYLGMLQREKRKK